MKKKNLSHLLGEFSAAISQWHVCPGCEGRFTANNLFKSDNGKFYCDNCLRTIEVIGEFSTAISHGKPGKTREHINE